MVDDLEKIGLLDAVNRLKHLVVIHQDNLLARIHMIDELRHGNAQLAQHPTGLGRQLTQARRLVHIAGGVAVRQDVLQFRIADRGADRVVIGILMAYDNDGFRHASGPFQSRPKRKMPRRNARQLRQSKCEKACATRV